MDELFENTLSPLPALEQARRDLVAAENDKESARLAGQITEFGIARFRVTQCQREVAWLERNSISQTL